MEQVASLTGTLQINERPDQQTNHPTAKVIWNKNIPKPLQREWKILMEKLITFYKNGLLIPIHNPLLSKRDHYDNMSSDHYRQIPLIVNTKLRKLTKDQFKMIFRYVPKHLYIDIEQQQTDNNDKRAHVQRFRNIPRDTRINLDLLLDDILYFAHTGLLVPVQNPTLSKYDHFRNLKKTHERRVPKSIFKRLQKKSNMELIQLFPRAAGTLTIKAEIDADNTITVDKSNIVYVNSLRLDFGESPLTGSINHFPIAGQNGIGTRAIILHAIPNHLHKHWFDLLIDIRRFFHVGLLIPTTGITIPENDKYRNYSPHGYRHIPPLLYDRIERILNSIPNKRQLKALFPNTSGTIYLNTDPITVRKPYRLLTNFTSSINAPILSDVITDEIIGEGSKFEDDQNKFEPVFGIANILPENESIIRSIDPDTGAGNVILHAQIQDPEFLDLVNQQVREYEIILKPLEPSRVTKVKETILPPLIREGYNLLPISVAIEGNIGAGKSKLLHDIQEHAKNYLMHYTLHTILEPIDIWDTYTEDDKPILELAHTQPDTYGFLYLVLLYAIKMATIRSATREATSTDILVYETSIQALDMVHNQILKDRRHISSIQSQVYQELLNEYGNEDIFATDIIYVDTYPEQCIANMELIPSVSNGIIGRSYLEISKRHLDEWFHNKARSTRLRIPGPSYSEPEHIKSERIDLITQFLLSRQSRPQQSVQHRKTKPIIYSFEGNIGSGKTSLLKKLSSYCEQQDRKDVLIILEPTKEWSKVRNQRGPILSLFYHDKSKYSFTFQTLVCTSIRNTIIKLAMENPHIKYFLLERSLLSSRHVFAKMLYDEGNMTDLEHKVYESLFLDTSYDWMNPSKMVYVKTSTQKCAERIISRINSASEFGFNPHKGEQLINNDYLDNITKQHEQYLFPKIGIEPIVVDGNIEDESQRQQIIYDLYNTLLGQENPNNSKRKIEQTHSLTVSQLPIPPPPKITLRQETTHPEEMLLTGIAQVISNDGECVTSINPITGTGMITLTAFINNPELLNWLNHRIDKYEIILRPIPIDESDSTINQHFHTLKEGTLGIKPRIIAIEGNIGAGKSTLLDNLKTHCIQNEVPNMVFVTEPTELWNKFRFEDRTLLELYYADPQTYGFIFQVMAYTTLCSTLTQTIRNSPTNSIFMCEKSLISAQYVYTKFLSKHKLITDTQRKVLYQLFQEEGVIDISASDMIYLHTKPENCLGKISRKTSDNTEIITLDYLTEYEHVFNELYDNSNTEDSLLLETDTAEHLEKIIRFITTRKIKSPTYMRLYPTYPKIISIEGNIGSGKTTLLKSISTWKNSNTRSNDIYVLWDHMKESHHLETEDGPFAKACHKDPIKYSFMRLVSLVTSFRNQIKRIIRDHPEVKFILCENSVLTIRWVLKDWLQKNGHLTTLEVQVLEELCDDPTLEWLNPIHTIFLNVHPKICMDRIQERIQSHISRTPDEYMESYQEITLSDLTQYKESLKNIHNITDTMEINGNHSDEETRSSWVTQILQLMPRL
jgi:deoxyadenosine/deoxycytidine kinase